ncbi:MAG: hypothetical protein JO020_03715 [Chloroflexi bacterium]|nr:hypothetical protein [Chloroflexota bacterium]MBV9893258.1 hypothetical protein [Chloroflexota bacterium]
MTGISAVLADQAVDESAVLDLAAVLEGLVGGHFEVILVCANEPPEVAGLRARAPRLPLRVVFGRDVADGCDAAQYELIFVAAGDGQFDVRELNHLLDAVELGADVAVGYRPRRMDGLVRRFQRWGLKMPVDCAFALVRREACQQVQRASAAVCCANLLATVRRHGFRVAEVPVSHRRPQMGVPVTTAA